MIEMPTNPECPECNKPMRIHIRRTVKHYRHSESMTEVVYTCTGVKCNTVANLRYSLSSRQIDNGGVYNERAY